jgi:hypothetical protein
MLQALFARLLIYSSTDENETLAVLGFTPPSGRRLTSSFGIAQRRFTTSVPLAFLVYLALFASFSRFSASQSRSEVVLAVRWRQRLDLTPLQLKLTMSFRYYI